MSGLLKIKDNYRWDLEGVEFAIIHRYDLIEEDGGIYGGVYDRTLKKVLMVNYGDVLKGI